MRNALLIPTMDNNLIPPFLIREAVFFLDETPECHAPTPSVTNHTIIDLDTGMHIHMELNGIFLYFLTLHLTLNKMEYWERYLVIYLSPDSDWWDPNSLDFSEQETAMLDADGYIVDRSPNEQLMIMDDVDVNQQ